MTILATWLGTRSERERRLLAALGIPLLAIGLTAVFLATRDHFGTLRARIEHRRKSLTAVRQLVAELRADAGPLPAGVPLVARVEATAARSVGRERLAALNPATTNEGHTLVTARVSDTSLAEAITFLHSLESRETAAQVAQLELRTRPGSDGRFDLLVEVTSAEGLP